MAKEDVMKERFFGTLSSVGALMCIALVMAGIVLAVRSNGEIDYCYAQMETYNGLQAYKLYGHRPWRMDMQIGTSMTLEDAKTKADLIGCRMNGSK